jgi:hypothetical protein
VFVGHYSASFLGRAADKKLPLWLLFIAVQFVDVLWAVFILLGIEQVRVVPGFTAASPLDLYYMPYTHSLVGALGWSLLAYFACQAVAALRGSRTGLILALAVFSHWILDLIVHRPDLALYDNHFKVGFGLWNYIWPSFLLEMAILWTGMWMFRRTAAYKARLIGLVIGLSLLQCVGTFFLPPPPSDRAEACMPLFFYFALAATAYWVDRVGQRAGQASAAA